MAEAGAEDKGRPPPARAPTMLSKQQGGKRNSAWVVDEVTAKKVKKEVRQRQRRRRIVRRFFQAFVLNFLCTLVFASFELYDVFIGSGQQSGRCAGIVNFDLPGYVHTINFVAQLVVQVILLRHAPLDIVKMLGLSSVADSPFSGSSRSLFYYYWWVYLVLAVFQIIVCMRILLTCGVTCNEYCFEHYFYTIGDWTCISMNVVFLAISWNPSFRKSFPMVLVVDASLGNPPAWDFDARPFVQLQFRDASGVPQSIRGVEFEVLLINYLEEFKYDAADFDAPPPLQDADQEDEHTRLLISKQERADAAPGHATSRMRDEDEFRVDLLTLVTLEPSTVSAVPVSMQTKPRAVRIATVKTDSANHGMLQIGGHDFRNVPPSLLVPNGTLLRVRPRHAVDRDLIPIQDAPHDIHVVGNMHSAPKRPPVVDVMVSHGTGGPGDALAPQLVAFLRAKGLSVFVKGEKRARRVARAFGSQARLEGGQAPQDGQGKGGDVEQGKGGQEDKDAGAEAGAGAGAVPGRAVAEADDDDDEEDGAQVLHHAMYCSFFVMLLDVQWVKSEECRYEYTMANQMALNHKQPVLMPVLNSSLEFWQAVKFFPVVDGMLTHINAEWLEPENPTKTFEAIFRNITKEREGQ